MMKTIPAALILAGLLAAPMHTAFAEGSKSRTQDSTSGTQDSTSRSDQSSVVDDSMITARVKGRMIQDPTVSAMRINVETKNGVVQISGFANSEAEKARASSIASSVPEVRQVQNDIVVRAGSDRDADSDSSRSGESSGGKMDDTTGGSSGSSGGSRY